MIVPSSSTHQLPTMDSTNMAEERPSKRIRLEEPIELTKDQQQEDHQLQKELNAGITCYVSPHTNGFSGILKQRSVKRDFSLQTNA
jgi:hypothetical protein